MLKAFKLFYIWELSDCPGFGYTYEFFDNLTTHVGQNFENFHEKNDFFQIDPESIWDGPWITRAWKNISLDPLEASGAMKNIT